MQLGSGMGIGFIAYFKYSRDVNQLVYSNFQLPTWRAGGPPVLDFLKIEKGLQQHVYAHIPPSIEVWGHAASLYPALGPTFM